MPECSRSVGRAWTIVVRGVAALAASSVALGVLWWWWFSFDTDPSYMPYRALRFGLAALEGMAVVIALLIAPAVLAGSLAGEKERGTLELLLTTSVNAWEIVTGRLTGKLVQVGIILLAGLPLWVLLAGLAGIRVPALLGMIGLPTVLAIGSGGVALAASAVSRKGRDALLTVYLAGFLLIPLITTSAGSYSPQAHAVVAPLNPFHGVAALVWDEDAHPAAWTMLIWVILGLIGLGVAAWRLRPSCLRLMSGEVRSLRRGRYWFVPPVDEGRPMLWKELFIERVSPLGRLGKWIGVLTVLLLIGLSTSYAGLVAYSRWWPSQASSDAEWYAGWIGSTIADSAAMVGYLIQIAVVLRAAVAISSERQRGTWDSLLTSPLLGRDIVVGKLCGSFYALRWLILAALWAWTLALIFGAMPLKDYCFHLLGVVVIGACMSAIGVRVSLATESATKSMALAVGLWLALLALLSVIAVILVFMIVVAINVFWWSFYHFTPPPGFATPFALMPMTFFDGWCTAMLFLYLVLAAAVVIESRYRFDRIAGRMTGGEVEVAVDQFLHGIPMAPIPVDGALLQEKALLLDLTGEPASLSSPPPSRSPS